MYSSPVEDINFVFKFIVYTPWISIQIYREPPGIFYFFALTPLFFFLNFWFTPLEFQRLLLYPLEFSIDILDRGL